MKIAIDQEISENALRVAADIWARATARRDELPEVPLASDKILGLHSALEAAGASLHIARQRERPVAFALLVPAGIAIELRYLGVDPAEWGSGIGGYFLDYVVDRAREAGCEALTLWVLEDNQRAIDVYHRSGWRSTPDVKSQIMSRRTERRLELLLT